MITVLNNVPVTKMELARSHCHFYPLKDVRRGMLDILEILNRKIKQIRMENKHKQGQIHGYPSCGWAGAVLEKVTRASGQESYAQKVQKRRKSNSRKSVRWSAVTVPCPSRL